MEAVARRWAVEPAELLGRTVPLAVVWVAIAGALAGWAFELGPLPAWLEYGPFVVSLVLLGLPHGAVDHIVMARLADEPLGSSTVIAWLAAYIAAVLAMLGAWWLAPGAMFAGFIALTWIHWGQGDVWFSVMRPPPTHLNRRWHRIAHLLVRGALPMVAPLAFYSEDYRRVFDAMTGLFGAGWSVAAVPWSTMSLVAQVGVPVVVVAYLVATRRAGATSWRVDAVESVSLLVFFALLPPIFAVGLYFCVWHGARHIVRLADFQEQASNWAAIAAIFRRSVPLTVVSLVGIIAIGWLWMRPDGSVGSVDLLAVYLVVISALTVPHVAVVFGMDRAERVWSH